MRKKNKHSIKKFIKPLKPLNILINEIDDLIKDSDKIIINKPIWSK